MAKLSAFELDSYSDSKCDNMMSKYIIFIGFLCLILMVVAIFQIPDDKLHIVACNVGQGDGILLTHGKSQILVDGGPDNKVLTCLGRHMPFWDREIDAIFLTHADSDHASGLIEVVKRYKVKKFISNMADSGTQTIRVLEKQVGSAELDTVLGVSPKSLRWGMIHLDILSPHNSQLELLGRSNNAGLISAYSDTKDLNKYSLVVFLSFKNFNALLSGDAPADVLEDLAEDPLVQDAEYIKISHHGSKTGLTQNLLELLRPKVAVVSAGKNNRWNFPAAEVLNLLNENKIKILRTDQIGDVEIVTDGDKYWQKRLFSFGAAR